MTYMDVVDTTMDPSGGAAAGHAFSFRHARRCRGPKCSESCRHAVVTRRGHVAAAGHWGHFHELGHNHQGYWNGYWNWDCTGEWVADARLVSRPLLHLHALESHSAVSLLVDRRCPVPCRRVSCNFFAARAYAVVKNVTTPENFYGW
jgi:hypothetical protein